MFSKLLAGILMLSGVLLGHLSLAQSDQLNWLPEDEAFPLLRYDVYETQPLFGANYISAPDSSYSGAYFIVNLAFRKSLLQWSTGPWISQIGFAAGVYTQFEVSKNENDEWLAGMLNSDFRAVFLYQMSNENHSIRTRVFHMSSHLADDYMLRNDFFQVNNSKGNYEQVDVTYAYSIYSLQPYVGAGYIFSPNAFRKRWSFQFGVQSKSIPDKTVHVIYGLDAQFQEENGFTPNLRGAFGYNFNINTISSLIIQVEGYHGRLPYSTIELGTVSWIGLSTIIGL